MILAFATWIGLIVGVAIAGGGITLGHMTALAVQLAFFGFATGALAIAIAAGTGRERSPPASPPPSPSSAG